MDGSAVLRHVVAAFPYEIHTVPTDDGMACADLPRSGTGPNRQFLDTHIFDRVCIEHGIALRRTKPCHSWTNGPFDGLRMRSRAHEKDDHGCDRQGLPLRRPREPEGACPGHRHGLHLRQAPRGPALDDLVTAHMPGLNRLRLIAVLSVAASSPYFRRIFCD
jgi:hypothetical protein